MRELNGTNVQKTRQHEELVLEMLQVGISRNTNEPNEQIQTDNDKIEHEQNENQSKAKYERKEIQQDEIDEPGHADKFDHNDKEDPSKQSQ
jgi:hypothetical protein